MTSDLWPLRSVLWPPLSLAREVFPYFTGQHVSVSAFQFVSFCPFEFQHVSVSAFQLFGFAPCSLTPQLSTAPSSVAPVFAHLPSSLFDLLPAAGPSACSGFLSFVFCPLSSALSSAPPSSPPWPTPGSSTSREQRAPPS